MMSGAIDSYCGLSCDACKYRETQGCRGCIASEGHPFYGKCGVAECAKAKYIVFCGECKDFPCSLLKSYSYDEKQGDNGARIERCRRLAVKK